MLPTWSLAVTVKVVSPSALTCTVAVVLSTVVAAIVVAPVAA